MSDDAHNGGGAKGDSQWPIWEVFVQSNTGAPHTHAGSLHAPDGEIALQNARDVYSRRGKVTNIWVVPSVHITASMPDDNPSFFDPAKDKVYRHPQFYDVPRDIRKIDERDKVND